MTFTKILVPYDDSEFSKKAFEKAIIIAKQFSSEIILLNVIEAEQSGDHEITTLDKLESKHDQQISESQSMLEDLKNNSKTQNIPTTTKTLHDPSPAKGIISFIGANDVDLVVMGSHGRTGLKKLVLGSIANHVVSNAQCPVLIVK